MIRIQISNLLMCRNDRPGKKKTENINSHYSLGTCRPSQKLQETQKPVKHIQKNEDFKVHDPLQEFHNFGTESTIYRSSHHRRSIENLLGRLFLYLQNFIQYQIQPEAVAQKCSVKKVFGIFPANLKKIIHAKV